MTLEREYNWEDRERRSGICCMGSSKADSTSLDIMKEKGDLVEGQMTKLAFLHDAPLGSSHPAHHRQLSTILLIFRLMNMLNSHLTAGNGTLGYSPFKYAFLKHFHNLLHHWFPTSGPQILLNYNSQKSCPGQLVVEGFWEF